MRLAPRSKRASCLAVAWHCSAAPHVLDKLTGENDEQIAGINILRRAIEAPLRYIAENAGIEGSIVVDKVKGLKGAHGFNAATETYEDLIKAGVIDPTKVVRTALQHAASVSGLLLTTEAMIAEQAGAQGRRWRRHAGHGWHGRNDVDPGQL